MRVLHIVSFISPDGAFGGPVRVAEHQASSLRARGHDVTVFAGQRGYSPELPSTAEMRLFRARRILPTSTFAGIGAPAMLPSLWRQLGETDVVHLHAARDLLTTPAGMLVRRRGVPYVVQPHGMIDESTNRLAHVMDAVATRRILTGAQRVLYFREVERRSLETITGTPLAAELLRNAVPVVDRAPPLPSRAEILFCARLHERKRPTAFTQMARALLDEGVDASFVLVGPDEGEGAAVTADVRAVGDADRLRWEGPLDRNRVLERMGRSSALVLPSFDEPYAVAVLEAMSLGRPVVVTESNGIAGEIEAHGCGVVVADDTQALTDAMRDLLAEPGRLAEARRPGVRGHPRPLQPGGRGGAPRGDLRRRHRPAGLAMSETATGRPSAAVLVCTYDRPAMLDTLLERLEALRDSQPSSPFRCVVVDDHPGGSAKAVVERRRDGGLDVTYVHAGGRNISLARNAAAAAAIDDEWWFLIDDDCLPADDWMTDARRGPGGHRGRHRVRSGPLRGRPRRAGVAHHAGLPRRQPLRPRRGAGVRCLRQLPRARWRGGATIPRSGSARTSGHVAARTSSS